MNKRFKSFAVINDRNNIRDLVYLCQDLIEEQLNNVYWNKLYEREIICISVIWDLEYYFKELTK